ncbi:MAG TPA: hypothetical protein VF815_06735 [Myxococcaceae bacterium]
MEELRVPKRRVGAQIVLPGGETRNVFVFLSEASPERHDGERLSDLLNTGAKFLPAMDASTATMLLFNAASIAVARVDAAHEPREEDQLTLLTEHEVEVRLVDGQRLQGLVTYVMPEGRTRLTDYFNQAQPFLRLQQEGRVALVNKLHVAYVETLSR